MREATTRRGKKKRTPSATKRAPRALGTKAAVYGRRRLRPVKISGKKIKVLTREDGPLEWLLPTMESAYAKLATRGALATMTQPIVGAPFEPDSPADADLVAVGAGQVVFLSEDFAASWPMNFTIPGGDPAGQIFALTLASPTRLYVGTTRGRVFRADRSGTAWSLARLDDVAAGPVGLDGLITDIAIDWADATLGSIYICFGGMGDPRRVWWFNGTTWQSRSGPAGGNSLLDVEHNALVVDRALPNNIYAGADIGVWHSSDGGQNWAPLQNGLPDAPVFDLQIHPSQRLLRAATHGRGVFEIALD